MEGQGVIAFVHGLPGPGEHPDDAEARKGKPLGQVVGCDVAGRRNENARPVARVKVVDDRRRGQRLCA